MSPAIHPRGGDSDFSTLPSESDILAQDEVLCTIKDSGNRYVYVVLDKNNNVVKRGSHSWGIVAAYRAWSDGRTVEGGTVQKGKAALKTLAEGKRSILQEELKTLAEKIKGNRIGANFENDYQDLTKEMHVIDAKHRLIAKVVSQTDIFKKEDRDSFQRDLDQAETPLEKRHVIFQEMDNLLKKLSEPQAKFQDFQDAMQFVKQYEGEMEPEFYRKTTEAIVAQMGNFALQHSAQNVFETIKTCTAALEFLKNNGVSIEKQQLVKDRINTLLSELIKDSADKDLKTQWSQLQKIVSNLKSNKAEEYLGVVGNHLKKTVLDELDAALASGDINKMKAAYGKFANARVGGEETRRVEQPHERLLPLFNQLGTGKAYNDRVNLIKEKICDPSVKRLEKDLQDVEGNLDAIKGRIERLDGELAQIPAETVPKDLEDASVSLSDLKQTLSALRRQEEELDRQIRTDMEPLEMNEVARERGGLKTDEALAASLKKRKHIEYINTWINAFGEAYKKKIGILGSVIGGEDTTKLALERFKANMATFQAQGGQVANDKMANQAFLNLLNSLGTDLSPREYRACLEELGKHLPEELRSEVKNKMATVRPEVSKEAGILAKFKGKAQEFIDDTLEKQRERNNLHKGIILRQFSNGLSNLAPTEEDLRSYRENREVLRQIHLDLKKDAVQLNAEHRTAFDSLSKGTGHQQLHLKVKGEILQLRDVQNRIKAQEDNLARVQKEQEERQQQHKERVMHARQSQEERAKIESALEKLNQTHIDLVAKQQKIEEDLAKVNAVRHTDHPTMTQLENVEIFAA